MLLQFVSLGLLLSGALVTYKILILASNSESPIVRALFLLYFSASYNQSYLH